jgi:hypothetical protein
MPGSAPSAAEAGKALFASLQSELEALQVWVRLQHDTGWIVAALNSPWTGSLEYRKQANRVWLRGNLNTGGSGPVVTLPEGFRPPAEGYYWTVVINGGASGIVNVTTAGVVSVASNAAAILNPVSYTTD